MKRIDIYYGGEHYSVGGRELDEVLDEVEACLTTGNHWLQVNYGEGMMRPARLLVTPGVALAIVPVPSDERELPPDAVWSEGGTPVFD